MAVASVGKRKAERRGCQVKAQIIQPGASEPIDCIIVDFSSTGARVKMNAQVDLPARFKLYIPSRPETKNVLLRWVKGLEFGCEYSTGVADEKTFFQLIDRVAKLERAGGTAGDADALADLVHRIEALEARQPAPVADTSADGEIDDDAAASLHLRIDKVAKTAESYAARTEQFLAGRVDETEGRLRELIAPDVAGRLARLEALAEAGALAPPPVDEGAASDGPDPRIVSRIADLEARLMSMARAPGGADSSALQVRLEQVSRHAEERAERIERFLMSRIDDIETQLISAPAAPTPHRSSEIADLDFRLQELASRFETQQTASSPPAVSSPDDLERLAERVSDLEVSVMELRIDQPAARPADDLDVHRRIIEIEGRHAEIIGTLRNLLALLSASEARRAAG